jgi:hypothetical protein
MFEARGSILREINDNVSFLFKQSTYFLVRVVQVASPLLSVECVMSRASHG